MARDRGLEAPESTASREESKQVESSIVSSEHSRVAMLATLFAPPDASRPPGVLLAIGDDAALLASDGATLVWSIDAQVEERHFRRAWMTLADIGYRATMAALSDLAAMGARPLGVLSALGLPLSFPDEDLRALAGGQREATIELCTRVLGGNMTRADVLSITTSVLGSAKRPVLRRGARAGDNVWLAGSVGRARCGLALSMASRSARTDADRAVLDAFRRPVALIDQGLAAAEHATAMIDLSDGLAADLGRLARESGVAVALDAALLGDSIVDEAAHDVGLDPFEAMLHGGEDYALVATAPPSATLRGFRLVGGVRDDLAPGVLVDRNGVLVRVDERGFDHFAAEG